MTQEEPGAITRQPFGLTCGSMALISLTVILIIGFVPTRLQIECDRDNANILCTPTPTSTFTSTPTETPTETLTPTPTETLTPTPTETFTPTPTGTFTPTPTPTVTPTPTETFTPTPTPTVTPTPTETFTPTPTPTSTYTSTPTPRPAVVIFVEIDDQDNLNLSKVSSRGTVIERRFVPKAAAPAWSPDGKIIAYFQETGSNVDEGVWTMDAQGGSSHQIFTEDHVKSITWSPDGQKLAFEFDPPGDGHGLAAEIHVVNPADGSDISNPFPGEQPAWSPDSQKLIIKGCLPECGLWRVALDGTPEKQITTDGTDSFPAWSPNGRYLVFTSRRETGDWEIWRLNLANNSLLRLTNRPGLDITPVFSPDGIEIYYLSDAFGKWQVRAMAIDGSNDRSILDIGGISEAWGLSRPAVDFAR